LSASVLVAPGRLRAEAVTSQIASLALSARRVGVLRQQVAAADVVRLSQPITTATCPRR
jgi:hypothetical protein